MARDRRWVARVTPTAGHDVDEVLARAGGVDVWERQDRALVVLAAEGDLQELERRGIADVERLALREDHVERARREERGSQGEEQA